MSLERLKRKSLHSTVRVLYTTLDEERKGHRQVLVSLRSTVVRLYEDLYGHIDQDLRTLPTLSVVTVVGEV